MSLSSAMHTAQSIFNNTGSQTATVSRNIANSGNPDYARRTSVIGTTIYGAQVMTIDRAMNSPLQRQTLSAISQNSGQQALLTGLESMKSVLGGNDYEKSPSEYLKLLQNKLHEYATKPGDAVVGATVISSAKDVVTALNTASQEVQNVRNEADREISVQVEKLNGLLSEFKLANDIVKSATALGNDANDALDRRESLLKQISEIVGVQQVPRENNDVVLYTTDGATLFETSPRLVSFDRTQFYNANIPTGNAIYIDGVAVPMAEGGNTTALGSLQAQLQLRDTVAPTFQKQLDEVARGLVTLFAETGGTVTGLFSWSGSPAIPAAGVIQPGIAGSIRVDTNATPTKLRDGNINGTNQNPDNNSGFSAVLSAYETNLDKPIVFSTDAGLDSQKSLLAYSTNSVSWLEALRSTASSAAENKTALLARTSEAYQNITGVSLDEELSLLLDIEQSYKASTKLVSTIDQMLQALLDIAS